VKALARATARCDSVPDPSIEDSRDAIIKVTACAIVALIPASMTAMHRSDILGHETMVEVSKLARP